ncbi:MAG: 30S ribosomal protein S7 [Patescibacteria group bacterium]
MRKKRVYKKYHKADQKYGRVDIGRFVGYVMKDGKKSVAERVVYDAFDLIHKISKEDPISIFEKALENVSPQIEVVSRRVGGANYQVPHEVTPARRFTLSVRWLVAASRSKKGKTMAQNIAEEVIAASKNEGSAIKKKQDMHRMAEANRAFAHFARSYSRS